MEPTNDRNDRVVNLSRALAREPTAPSTRRYDAAVVAITALTGILTGIVLALAYLMAAGLSEIVLLAALLPVAAATIWLTIRYRNARQTDAFAEWARQIQATQSSPLETSTENADARADAAERPPPFPTTPVLMAEPFVVTPIPFISGWEALGITESEIAPQLPILAALFQGQPRIQLYKKFSGGYRNRGVYQVRAANEADRVVKIARSADIRAERRAQELINRFSQNNGGQYMRDVQSANDAEYGGIVYRLASLRRNSNIKSFDAFYRETQDPAVCAGMIEQIYSEALPHSQFRQVRQMSLFQEYALPPQKLDKIAQSVMQLGLVENEMLADESVRVRFGNSTLRIQNPLHWGAHTMPKLQDLEMSAVCGVIHGDLHSGNLLVETPGHNVWIIDFARTRAGANTLTDFARFEADLKFYLVPGIENEGYLEEALAFEHILLGGDHPDDLMIPDTAFTGLSAEFQKAAVSILALRRVAVKHRRDTPAEHDGHFADGSVLPYFLALWHASLRTLRYEQSNAAQKTYALVSASLLCERITRIISRSD